MASHGLTDAQWKPVWHLRAGRQATVSQLAADSDIDVSAMTRMLDRLAKKGHVERFRRKPDRRVVWVRLTPAGEQASLVIPKALHAVEHGLLASLSAGDRRRIHELLSLMRVAADRNVAHL